jgi:prolyl 4-hydroxylase
LPFGLANLKVMIGPVAALGHNRRNARISKQALAGMAVQQSSSAQPALSVDVERAERSDAAGAHGDAVNHLAAGARKGDVEALTRLGKRLLVGDRAPSLPKDAIGLIGDASKRGGAEAAALLSVLHAVGVGRSSDVRAGFESLVAAAERGWRPAQAQLEVLAAGLAGDAERAPAGAVDWRSVAQGVDLGAWLSGPPSNDVSASPLVRSFPAFASPRMCRWFIERARGRLSRALVYEAISREVMARPTRTNTAAAFGILDTDFLFVISQLRMAACLGIPLRHFEAATVLHYEVGEEITDHYDFVDPNVPDYAEEIAQRGDRIVTFLLYLNDDYASGETAFPRLGISHKGTRGEGMFFVNARDGKADTRTLHAGRSPAGGEKWIISQFIRNRPVF